MLSTSFWEEKKRVGAAFAEVYFVLMRYRRYGISDCVGCGDGELLAAQLEVLKWMEEKEEEDIES